MKKKVLIIDDEEDIRNIIGEFCEMIGVDKRICSNGKEGIEMFKKENFDLVISDIKMPDMDGYEFVKKIRELDNSIPVVICSGFIDEKTKDKFKEIGINYYLEKPFKLKDIKDLIDKLT